MAPSLLRRVDHQLVGLLSVLFILVGLLFSRAMMSIGMIGLVANAVFNLRLAENSRRFLRHPVLLGLTAVFFLFLISGLYSENTAWLVDRLRMKLPFLLLPVSIVAIPRLDRRVYGGLLSFFFLLIVLLCLHSLLLYLTDYERITYQYREGRVMPTPVAHIPFSLMVAYGAAIGWFLYREGFYLRWRGERYALLLGGLFLFGYLHLLAVRTGLVAGYAAAAFAVFDYVRGSRRYWLGLAVTLGLAAGVALAMRYVPTIKNKVDYTLYSLRLFQQKEGLAVLSDSYRLATIEAGIALGNAHPWTGVGVGDLRDATHAYLQEHYPSLTGEIYMPQSQFVLAYAALGIVGLLAFAAATAFPLWYRHGYTDGPAAAFHVMALVSFVVEQPLETQIGTAFYITFALLGIRQRSS